MLDLGIDHMYDESNIGQCVEKIEKECFSVDTGKECNDSKLSQNVFNDSLFDLMEFSGESMCDCPDILLNMEENPPEYTFQHSHSDDSSILSFTEPKSPSCSLNDIEIKYEFPNNQMQFQGLENFVNYEMPRSAGYSKYSNYTKLPPIIFQPFLPTYNHVVSSSMDTCYNYPIMSNNSNLINLPRDTIVYVPTPMRNLQSNMYFNQQFNMSPQTSYPVDSLSNFRSTSVSGPMMFHSEMKTGLSIEEIEPATSFSEKPLKPKKTVQCEKTFCCSTCEVKFTRRDELRRHEKIHSGEKPLSCPYCDKCFIRSDHRKTHIRTHTGEKPYACDICLKRFARSDEKLRHTKTHFRERPRRRRRKKINDQQSFQEVPAYSVPPEMSIDYSNIQREPCSYYDESIVQQTFPSFNNEFSNDSTYSPLFLEQMWNN